MDVEKKRTSKIIALIAIIIALLGLSFSFAAFSTNLKIDGVGEMSGRDWDVHFENLSQADINGDVLELSKPSINSNATSISTYKVRFNAPSSSISYTFDIVNDGGIDAKISTLPIYNPSCEGTGNNKDNDEQLVCNNLNYKLTYMNNENLRLGDVIKRNSSVKVKLTLAYEGNELPLEKVNISNLGINLIYSQN